ncbi:V-type proton ATPase subunit e-like [Coccinella septempunctata]|uniref:V-type proton ATPase subunit e-like n=1 Tax=Coccinella septempunctata TaxID=41139 RepID=UPI001D06C317|nr:V-type proton ATPase subunit e-like [Coccinella septempunctata]
MTLYAINHSQFEFACLVRVKMGFSLISFAISTAFWGAIGIIGPFCVPRSRNRSIIRLCLILTAICCWLFWLCSYVVQMNPLLGPKMYKEKFLIMAKNWGSYSGV